MSESEARAGAGTEPSAAEAQVTTGDAAGQPTPPRLAVSRREPAGATLPRPLSPRARTRLTQLLIGKSICEALFVGALAVAFAYGAARPSFRGALDAATPNEVAGWAVDASAPDEPVELQVYVDGHFAARGRADCKRPDVASAGHAADEYHGFVLRLPPLPPGTHEARVYAVRAGFGGQLITLRQIGQAQRFDVPADASGMSVPPEWWKSLGGH